MSSAYANTFNFSLPTFISLESFLYFVSIFEMLNWIILAISDINYLYVFYIPLYVYVGMLVVKKGNLIGVSIIALLYWNMVLIMPLKVSLKLCYLEQ